VDDLDILVLREVIYEVLPCPGEVVERSARLDLGVGDDQMCRHEASLCP
jgi:hypothetical protein